MLLYKLIGILSCILLVQSQKVAKTKCEKDADCRRNQECIDSQCKCGRGFVGNMCDEMCPGDTYGYECESTCTGCIYGCDNVEGNCFQKCYDDDPPIKRRKCIPRPKPEPTPIITNTAILVIGSVIFVMFMIIIVIAVIKIFQYKSHQSVDYASPYAYCGVPLNTTYSENDESVYSLPMYAQVNKMRKPAESLMDDVKLYENI